jgi:predicted TIM-barrel fold metal-dependent hydrolase
MEEEFFCPFRGFIATAVAVHHPMTQVNITHMGCTVFDD